MKREPTGRSLRWFDARRESVVYAWTRQSTGTPRARRAYLRDSASGRILAACPHKHRRERTALDCATQLLATYVRQQKER